ncbi:MAG: hypothetical protein LUG93_02300 [Lachnospiraceae bacterium]|nr:hypothetical protein [Lachnospiraceae bacterium]
MQLYRAVIRPVASFSSQLQSDTLFGTFCWSYKYSCGEEALGELLQVMKSGEPPVIFSNAFPSGTVPMPLGIYDKSADLENIKTKNARKAAYQNRKKLKSAGYIKREWFERIQRGDSDGFTVGLQSDSIQEQTVIHNMVVRDSGQVENVDGSGSLYEEDEFYPTRDILYDIYILSSLDAELLKKTVEMMLLLGIGKNKSTGKGAFELMDWKEDSFSIQNANAFMALSNFVPAKNDPTDGRYKILIKYGKLDREFASEEIPFKKPILFFQAGALFRTDEVKPFYGKCLEQVSVKREVVTNAYTIAVPVCLEVERSS